MWNWIILILVPMLIGLWAQAMVTSAFSKWKGVRTSGNRTGSEVAREILAAANIRDVEVVPIDGSLSDHYDPTRKVLCLSPEVYDVPSVAAVGIAAHECGHAIQHAKAYAPLQWRMTIVPVTQIASQMLPIIFIGGLFFHAFNLAILAVICFFVLAVFNLITLPVEFDASRRAKIVLREMRMIQPGVETDGVNRVLNAAALTYVAAFVAVLGQLIYFLMQANRSR